MKTPPPQFWVGPELARRLLKGESPVLSDEQLREDNSHGGLNLVVLEVELVQGTRRIRNCIGT